VLSVVVLCYKQAKYVGECLQSIVDQALDVPFEVIVGDDNSPDDSLDVIESYRLRYPHLIKVVAHERNVGFSTNLKDCIALTQGEYIANIDADDIMLPGKLQRQLSFLRDHPEYGFVVHKMRTVHADTKEPVDFPLPRKKPREFGADYIIEHGPFFYHSTEMYRAHLRKRRPVDVTITAVSDVLHILETLYGARACYLDEEYGLYRVNPTGATSNIINNAKRRKHYIEDLLYTCGVAERLGMARDVVDRGRAKMYLSSAIFYLERGYCEDFVKCIEGSRTAARLSLKQEALYRMRRWPRGLGRFYTYAKQSLGRQQLRA
jgi:glycosyltransferase involved in cell wall biosynthesis